MVAIVRKMQLFCLSAYCHLVICTGLLLKKKATRTDEWCPIARAKMTV